MCEVLYGLKLDLYDDGVIGPCGRPADALEGGVVGELVWAGLAKDGGTCCADVADFALAWLPFQLGERIVDGYADGVGIVRVVGFCLDACRKAFEKVLELGPDRRLF